MVLKALLLHSGRINVLGRGREVAPSPFALFSCPSPNLLFNNSFAFHSTFHSFSTEVVKEILHLIRVKIFPKIFFLHLPLSTFKHSTSRSAQVRSTAPTATEEVRALQETLRLQVFLHVVLWVLFSWLFLVWNKCIKSYSSMSSLL